MRLLSVLTLAAALLSGPVAAQSVPPKHVVLCDSSVKAYGEANIASCTKALAAPGLIDDDRARLLNIRGNNYDALKQYDSAIADYTAVIALKPSFLDYAYANRALEHCRKGEWKTAIADYDAALHINPDNTYALYGRGVAKIRAGDKTAGQADIDKADGGDPDVAGTYREIGMEP